MSLWNSTHAREASTNDGVFAQYKKEFLESIKRAVFRTTIKRLGEFFESIKKDFLDRYRGGL